MKWNHDYFGISCLTANKNLTIQIPSEEIGEQIVKLKRLEPWESKRVLGICLLMSEDMQKEYQYRVTQIDSLGETIQGSILI